MLGFMERNAIKHLKRKGHNNTQIAEMVGTSRKTVQRVLNEPSLTVSSGMFCLKSIMNTDFIAVRAVVLYTITETGYKGFKLLPCLHLRVLISLIHSKVPYSKATG